MSGLAGWTGVVVALALFCAAQAVFWWLRARRRQRESELQRRLKGGPEELAGGEVGGIRIRRGVGEQQSLEQRLGRALEQGGIGMTARSFLLAWGGASALIAAALIWSSGSLISGIAALGMVAAAASLHVGRKRTARLQLMAEQLPRALELIVLGLRAGHALEESIGVAAEETEEPLGFEFARVYEEYKLGRPIEAALEAMRSRWPMVRPIGSFVESVGVLKRTGGNLIEVMETLVTAIRAQAAFEARHRALTAEGKSSALILMIIPFAAFGLQAVMAPAQIDKLLAEASGQKLLLVGGLMWALGSLWTLRLTKLGGD
jgi:tight adherence protein B